MIDLSTEIDQRLWVCWSKLYELEIAKEDKENKKQDRRKVILVGVIKLGHMLCNLTRC